MENIQAFKTSVRRQRFAIVGLATLLAGCADRVATITCKEWGLVDKDGKVRIEANTRADGTAAVTWFDKDGNRRIQATTLADGTAAVTWFDKDGKIRINTFAVGEMPYLAGMSWADKDGEIRIAGATNANGTVVYPTATGR
jgi:hypothetical protein